MNDLKEIDWNQALNKQDIDSAVNDWNNLFTHVADSHAPMRKSRIKGVRSPWINQGHPTNDFGKISVRM